MKACIKLYFLGLILVLLPSANVRAQLLETGDWPAWNETMPAVFPVETWMRYQSPEQAGWSSQKLAQARDLSQRAGSAAVTIVYNGAILDQWGQTRRRYMCHSVRKSLLSALYGIAVDEGVIDIEETIGSIGIDDSRGLTGTEKSAKVSDLLKARSGVYLPAAYETRGMKESRPKRGSHEPGTHWYYNNWDFNALATIYNRKTSGDLFDAFQQRIAAPLQMQDFELRHTYYHLEPENSRHAAYPFRLSARDMARFGLLFLNQGLWAGQRILSADWVNESTRAHSRHSDGGYGYMWWSASQYSRLGKMGAYMAAGYGGHRIYVVPAARLVFIHRADTYQGKHVNGTAIRNILMEVLKARTGPPRESPTLVAMDAPGVALDEVRLSPARISALAGEYSNKRHVVELRGVDGRLEIRSPGWGNFYLDPVEGDRFLVEDALVPAEFEIDAAGKAKSLTVWLKPDEAYELRRKAADGAEKASIEDRSN